jgi:hypothetical protein
MIVAQAICTVDREQLLSVFNRYARHEHAGERYMTPHEFLQDYLGYLQDEHVEPVTLDILSSLVDLNKDQSLSVVIVHDGTCSCQRILSL